MMNGDEIPTAGLALARRLEAANAAAGVWCHEALCRLRPDAGALERLAGGVVAFAGVESPLTQARGLGMSGPVTADDMDRLEDFFRSRGCDAISVELCPYADPTLVDHLARRGYGVRAFTHVLGRSLRGAALAAPPPDGVRVTRPSVGDAAAWARLVARGFGASGELPSAALDEGILLFHVAIARCFWAHVDGVPAGGGAMAIEGGLASLFGTSTLPDFRRRGVQRALLDARLALAAAEGCDLAQVGTEPGSGSHRNAERAGFRVAYTRVTVERRWP